MKICRVITFIIIYLAGWPSFAQTDNIRIGFEHHQKVYKDKKKERVDKYILHTDYKSSTFYNPNTYFLDKSAHDENARNAYGQMASAMQANGQGSLVPNRSVSTYVFKSFDNQNLRVYQDNNEDYIYYDEPFEEMNWEIVEDSTKTVLDYECIMAETDYHGVHWTAWFTPEIPVHDGPWKFEGPPGMILMVSDYSGNHTFVATGLEYTAESIPVMEVPEYYSKGNRLEFIKHSSKSIDGYIAELKAMYPESGIKLRFPGGQELSIDEISEYYSSFDPNFQGLEIDYIHADK
ncbi:MAG: GLPGLI family protein [Muribaculaceae bacterium]|nr:GLPGLI family protein [Muribaculaceae bacterium]